MSDTVLELVERGRALSPEQQTRLVDLLLATLDESAPVELAAAWDREIERRIAAYKAGEIEAYDLEEILDEARKLAP